MTYVLHHTPLSRSMRVLWLMEEMGLDYELKLVGPAPRPPEFLALSPLGVVPALDAGTEVILESGAIVQYLLAKHGPTVLQVAKEEPNFAAYLQWFHFGEASFTIALANHVLASRTNAPNANEALSKLQAQLAYIGQVLSTRTYLAGDHFTAADIMLGYGAYIANKLGAMQGAPQSVLDYLARITERPAFGRSAFTS